MSPWDLRFDPNEPSDLEPIGGGRFRVRVHTEPGLTQGTAVVREGDEVLAIPLTAMAAGRFVMWSATLGAFDQPVGLSFAFRVAESGRPVYLVPSGTSSSVERLDRWTIRPDLPQIDTPEWVQGAVIYQIFPERFANGDADNDPPGTVPWGTPPRPRQFQGGDLDGILQRLDYLDRMGVDALYLNPIFRSPSNHKYDTVDYYEVDPAFGGNDAFRRLMEAAHRRGMRVILDASFNHVHPRFFAFADLLRRGRRSEYRDWFVVHDWPPRIRVRRAQASTTTLNWIETWKEETGLSVEETDAVGPAVEPTYEAWYGVPTMPRLDLANPGAREYVLNVARHWIREFDIDGWRMDVARYIDPDFWPEFRRACRDEKSDTYLLAEIMGDVRPWLRGDGFDATMNYTFRSLALGFFANETMDGVRFLDHCTRMYGRHALETTLANHNLIGSHDTPRFLTEAGEDMWRLRLATVFQLTYPGAAGIYYGDEAGLTGGNDPGCRGAMPWGGATERWELVDTIAQLTAIRRRSPVWKRGSYAPEAASEHAAVFSRTLGRSRVLAGFNRQARAVTLEVPGSGVTVWGNGRLEAGQMTIGARSAVLIRT